MTAADFRVKRRRFVFVRVADENVFDLQTFLTGKVVARREARCTLLCPVRGSALSISASDFELLAGLPSDRWTGSTDSTVADEAWARVVDLARRGVVLSDPALEEWADIAAAETALDRLQWDDLTAVFHAHTRWQDVAGPLAEDRSTDAHVGRLETLRRDRGDPPPHFVRRADAQHRIPLEVPALEGPFFEALLARRTTRAFTSLEPLPLSRLTIVLHAVFGVHGFKEFAPGIAAVRRTSPSGGALHPIEAYVIATDVEGLQTGLYHYETGGHALALLEAFDKTTASRLVCDFTAGQTYFADAHAVVIHVARFDRNLWKYARHRKAYKSVLMDSAHLSQTFYLTAAHLGLGAFVTAAINDVNIGTRLRLDPVREAAVAINGIGIASADNAVHFMADPYRPQDIV